MRRWSKWKPTLPTACHISISSACPILKSKKAATVCVPPLFKAASTFPPRKLPSTSHRPTSQKNPAVSICRLPWAFLPLQDKLTLKSSPNMSLPANWHCPACCVPYVARWPWHGRECRPAVRSFCHKKMPNRLPLCAVSRFMVHVL